MQHMQQMNPNQFRDVSASAIGGFDVAGRGVYITFQWHNVRVETTDPLLHGKTERRLKLTKTPVGDPSTASVTYITEEIAREHFPIEWKYFTDHGDMPLKGTAISELPGISQSQIQMMQLGGLRSIEDIISVPMEVIARIGFEGQEVRKVAESWMAKKNDNADLTNNAAALAAHEIALAAANRRAETADAEMAAMRAELEAMRRMMGGSGSSLSGLQPVAPNGDAQRMRSPEPDVDNTPNPLAEGSGEMELLNED